METRIFVLMQGFVLTGEIQKETQTQYKLSKCATIRRWGTSKGLGELASKGKTTDTILDQQADTLVYKHCILFEIPCVPRSNTSKRGLFRLIL